MKNKIYLICLITLLAFSNCNQNTPDVTQIPDQGIPKRDGGSTKDSTSNTPSVGGTENNKGSASTSSPGSTGATQAH